MFMTKKKHKDEPIAESRKYVPVAGTTVPKLEIKTYIII